MTVDDKYKQVTRIC